MEGLSRSAAKEGKSLNKSPDYQLSCLRSQYALLTCLLLVVFCNPALADDNSIEKIHNYYPLTDSIASAGQPTAGQFVAIARAGYSTVVNLAMHDSHNAMPEEGSIVAAHGMAYIHIPVPWEAPSRAHMEKFFRLMDALENEKVFVHCAANYRASAFNYKYLTLRKGITTDRATSPILREWLADMDDNWKAIMALDAGDF